MNRYDAVTFDMGYTLTYFHPSEEALMLSAYHSVGLHPDPAALRQARDQVWREYFAQAAHNTFQPSRARDWELEEEMTQKILDRLGFHDPGLVARLLVATEAIFDTPGVLRAYPEVEGVLQALRSRGYRLGVVSNWSWNLEERIRQAGLDGYFDVLMPSACAGCDKPHPMIFQRALQALGVPPARAIHIGDSYEADVIGARRAGMEAVWLDRQKVGGHPDCPTIHTLDEVLAILE